MAMLAQIGGVFWFFCAKSITPVETEFDAGCHSILKKLFAFTSAALLFSASGEGIWFIDCKSSNW
jgi:hypothetical protein